MMKDIIQRLHREIISERHEILKAFIAKHGIQPEDAVQVERRMPDGSTQWIVRLITPRERKDIMMSVSEQPAPPDPWQHRSANMRCATCMWFVEKASDKPDITSRVGRCRRHAPTMGGYPVVYDNDWCGDHRVDENKT